MHRDCQHGNHQQNCLHSELFALIWGTATFEELSYGHDLNTARLIFVLPQLQWLPMTPDFGAPWVIWGRLKSAP